jgi:hypothetical protein
MSKLKKDSQVFLSGKIKEYLNENWKNLYSQK